MAAKKTPSSLDGLTFYMVPLSWLAKAWPMLDARSTMNVSASGRASRDDYGKWRENVGIIKASELLSTHHNHTVSSDEEGTENGNRKPVNGTSQQQQQQQAPPSVSLRPDLKHGVDYCLLGPSVWFLVKEKFGYDKEIGRPCVFHTTNDSTLAVAIDNQNQQQQQQQPTNGGNPGNQVASHKHNLIPIPLAGYFPYKQLLSDLEGDSEETFLPQPARQHQQAPDPFEPQQHAPDTTQTTVSDDEGGENDLVRSFPFWLLILTR
jgi:hypothetical protein